MCERCVTHARSLMFDPDVLRISRRGMLGAGSLALTGLALPEILLADALRNVTGGKAAAADACILIFLNGGPSHLDMWDLKPEAPLEIRGEFQPIESTLPGTPLCEHLPRL